jgi:ABC-type amino acid transport substrate-binding protein/ABC-type branched-subunit amino acid transport system substrate-binding protein
MLDLRGSQLLWCYFLFVQSVLPFVKTSWPPSTSSSVQLLGLFSDALNTSSPTTLSVHSRAMFQAAIILSQQYNITIQGQLIGWQSVQTGGDAMNALINTCTSISPSNIFGIVGPEFSSEALFIAPFAAQIGIPVISNSATDPDLSDRNTYPAFYRTVPSDNIAALAIVDLFNRFNWTSCVIIYQNDAFGSGGVQAISEAFQTTNLTVINTIPFDTITFTIQGNLKTLLTSSGTQTIILWAAPNYTPLVLQSALDSDVLGPQFTWILSSNIPMNSFNKTSYDKLSGMITVAPVVGNVVNASFNTTLLNAAYQIWQQYEPETFPGLDNVDYYAFFAFDATWTLIQALKQLCSSYINNSSSCVSFNNDSLCFNQRFLNSDSFFNIIDSTTFVGVSGSIEFSANSTDRIKGNYYIAKNLQLSPGGLNSVPVLIWSDDDGWTSYTPTNTIIWPGNSSIPPTGQASTPGVTLRIAVIESVPFTIVTRITNDSAETTTKLSGYIPDLIELLRKRMRFIPNIVLVSSNETYDGLIDAMVNGDYDMVAADMTITYERSEKVDFSQSIFDDSLRIITQQASKPDIDLWAYLRPFSLKVWMTLLVAGICAGLLFYLLERKENEVLKERSTTSQISMGLWYSFGTILGYGADFHVTTAAGRLLTLSLYILCLISVASYTANLTSNLTLSKSQNIVSGLDDIKNGKVSFSRIGIIVGTVAEDYYLHEISSGIRNFYPLKTDKQMYNCLLNNIIDVSITDGGASEYMTNNVYCNLTLVGADFDDSAFGIVFQKNWQYAQDFDVNILALRESGAITDLRTKWFDATNCSQSPDSSNTDTAMTIESMAGLCLTFGIIYILAVLLFTWQKRLIIKDYLLRLIQKKSIDEEASAAKDSIDTISEHLSNSRSDTYITIYL